MATPPCRRSSSGSGITKIEVDGKPDLEAHGKVLDHEYKIERDGNTIAKVLEEVVPRAGEPTASRSSRGEDVSLLLAISAALTRCHSADLTCSEGRGSWSY